MVADKIIEIVGLMAQRPETKWTNRMEYHMTCSEIKEL